MDSAKAWIEQYAQITRALAACMDREDGQDVEQKLSALESLLLERQKLLDQLGQITLTESQKCDCRGYVEGIKGAEDKIIGWIERMRTALEDELREIRDERTALNMRSKANRSYSGITKSGEGYFIDRKK